MDKKTEMLCSLCGALPGKPCVSDRGRTREYPHKVRQADNLATEALRKQLAAKDAEWRARIGNLKMAAKDFLNEYDPGGDTMLGRYLIRALRPFEQKPVGFQDCAL